MTPDSRVSLFDVNALLALVLTTHQHHRAAHAFLGPLSAWATTPVTESGLARLLLNPAITGTRSGGIPVLSAIAGLADDPRWRFLPDDTRLSETTLTTNVLMGHKQVTDLHLANVAARHGARLCTFDASLLQWLAPADRQHVELIPS
ncbi:type II toxin-antitoxin system VapC family toxin [Tessaracoccus lubricantis]|uniref:Ribonuclease VapC n=1 Tax=Tessaracoccus lubricantis TaxID=545543 RepID=A0ABP9EWH4_9ACTN